MERCVERCEGFKVVDANKQTVAYVSAPADKRDADYRRVDDS